MSAVARRCPPRLRDEWLVCKDGEEGEEEERLSYVRELRSTTSVRYSQSLQIESRNRYSFTGANIPWQKIPSRDATHI